ncbi:hypothetical protein BX600DRAFT_480934 [Xylariales sp. PMI_506]|nr:hypothetical protein BX600DRAFT_480934 [Xylariales sp. PMI_506]
MFLDWRGAAWLALLVLPFAACQADDYFAANQLPLGGAVANRTILNCQRAWYFTAQHRETVPMCAVQPRTPEAVALAVRSVRDNQCAFAIKSGGHSTTEGSSSVDDGIVVDLRYLNQITISDDRETVSLGPGARWGDVYQYLEPHGLLVVGGRAFDVGVGGFILGGGLSYLSRRHGWAMDNVRNFEASCPPRLFPEIRYPTSANQSSHRDLYFALRGGHGNFGIVTRFDVKAYQHDSVWGGYALHILGDISSRKAALGLPESEPFRWDLASATDTAVRWVTGAAEKLKHTTNTHDIIDAFTNMANAESLDPGAHTFISLSWPYYLRAFIAGTYYVYDQPVANPTVLANFTKLPSMYSKIGVSPMSKIVKHISDLTPWGERHYWRTATFKLNRELISTFWDIFIFETETSKACLTSAMMSSNVQMLTRDQIALALEIGGNAFGLDVEDGPLMLISMASSCTAENCLEGIKRVTDRIMSRILEAGKEMDLYHPYVYPNYVAADQDVFKGYSPANLQKLSDIQEVYDPKGYFAKLQPKGLRMH